VASAITTAYHIERCPARGPPVWHVCVPCGGVRCAMCAATGGAAAPGVWSRRKKESRLKQPIVHAAHGSVRAEWLQRTVSSRPSHRTTCLQVITLYIRDVKAEIGMEVEAGTARNKRSKASTGVHRTHAHKYSHNTAPSERYRIHTRIQTHEGI
jgi:hypothetical protein